MDYYELGDDGRPIPSRYTLGAPLTETVRVTKIDGKIISTVFLCISQPPNFETMIFGCDREFKARSHDIMGALINHEAAIMAAGIPTLEYTVC